MGFIQTKILSVGKTRAATWIWFSITLLVILAVTLLGPAEHSLRTHIRIVYLHAAWVWGSIIDLLFAALCGGIGLITRLKVFHCWSRALGRTGIVFWITYLPLSLWAMQANWNGLFLAEPRWRLALVFAVAGLLLQVGMSLIDIPILTSSLNLGYFIALIIVLIFTPNVMHPVSPILQSDAWRIQVFFFGLVVLILLAGWQMARWWYEGEPGCAR